MFDNDGRIKLAARGLVAAVVLVAVGFPIFHAFTTFQSIQDRRQRVEQMPNCKGAQTKACVDPILLAELRSSNAGEDAVDVSLLQLEIGVVGIGFVVATLIYTAIAARAAQDAAIIAERTLVADKRAFVFAEGFNSFFESGPKKGEYVWRFRPIWKNTGDTPTKNLRLHFDGELRSTPLPIGFNFDVASIPPGTGLLGPNSGSMGGVWPYPGMTPLSISDVEDIIAGRRFLYIWGWVRYLDVFPDSKEHVTRFCWQMVATGDPRKFKPEAQTVQWGNLHHHEGNCADDECQLRQKS